MAYRDDVEALAAREAALDRELAETRRERDVAARQLREARAAQRPPEIHAGRRSVLDPPRRRGGHSPAGMVIAGAILLAGISALFMIDGQAAPNAPVPAPP